MPRIRVILAAGAACLVGAGAPAAAQEAPELQIEPQIELQEPQNPPQEDAAPQADAAPADNELFDSALDALRDIFPPEAAPEEAQDAAAAEPPPAPQPDYETDPDLPRLDKLFLRLANLSEEDSRAADRLANDILAELSRHGSPTAELLLKRARLAERLGRRDQAIDHATRAIAFQPDFAEAWHFRATIYFEQNDYGLAMRDLNQALRAEPRHFAAWVGLGVILEELDRKEDAAAAYRSALAWHPYMARAQEKLQELEDELYGEPA